MKTCLVELQSFFYVRCRFVQCFLLQIKLIYQQCFMIPHNSLVLVRHTEDRYSWSINVARGKERKINSLVGARSNNI